VRAHGVLWHQRRSHGVGRLHRSNQKSAVEVHPTTSLYGSGGARHGVKYYVFCWLKRTLGYLCGISFSLNATETAERVWPRAAIATW
jgi:hypothetical protein